MTEGAVGEGSGGGTWFVASSQYSGVSIASTAAAAEAAVTSKGANCVVEA
jgi:hypothetical protein